jgi:hypothetical protein
MGDPSAPARSGRRGQSELPRRYSALRIRAWVLADEYALDEDALHRELTRRADLIDGAMRRALALLGEDLAPPTESTPRTPALYAVPGASLTTPEDRRRTDVAASGTRSPAITGRATTTRADRSRGWSGPWRSGTGRHWAGFTCSTCPGRSFWRPIGGRSSSRRFKMAVRRGPSPRSRWLKLEREASDATGFVTLDPVAANLGLYTCGLRAELIRRSQDGDPRHNEPERARAAKEALDRAGVSRERGCTAAELDRLLARYRSLHPGMAMRRAHQVLAHEWGLRPKRGRCAPEQRPAVRADSGGVGG